MIATNPECPPGVAMLADHLDTALAVAEDLLRAGFPARADLDEADASTAPERWDQSMQRLAELEASLMLRVLQSRRLLSEIGRADSTLKMAGGLFRAEVDLLQALVLKGPSNELVPSLPHGDGHAYLRSRGLLAPEAAGPSPFEALAVSERFRIGGVVGLGGLMDMIAALLDFLDARFGLYADDAAFAPRHADQSRPVPRAEHDAVEPAEGESKRERSSEVMPMTLAEALKAVKGGTPRALDAELPSSPLTSTAMTEAPPPA